MDEAHSPALGGIGKPMISELRAFDYVPPPEPEAPVDAVERWHKREG